MFRSLRAAFRRRPATPPALLPGRASDHAEFLDTLAISALEAAPSWPTPPADLQEHVATADTFASAAADAVLPRRTPGLSVARGHAWTGVHHGLGALRAVTAWDDVRHDPDRGSEADVLYVAACHQLEAAGTALAAAREALAAIAKGGRR